MITIIIKVAYVIGDVSDSKKIIKYFLLFLLFLFSFSLPHGQLSGLLHRKAL
jgi:hypothetical protein